MTRRRVKAALATEAESRVYTTLAKCVRDKSVDGEHPPPTHPIAPSRAPPQIRLQESSKQKRQPRRAARAGTAARPAKALVR